MWWKTKREKCMHVACGMKNLAKVIFVFAFAAMISVMTAPVSRALTPTCTLQQNSAAKADCPPADFSPKSIAIHGNKIYKPDDYSNKVTILDMSGASIGEFKTKGSGNGHSIVRWELHLMQMALFMLLIVTIVAFKSSIQMV